MNVSTYLFPLFLIFAISVDSVFSDDSTRTQPQPVDAQLISECMSILRGGLVSEEFWPAMHAAEALTYAGAGSEVIAALTSRLPDEQDDQRRCGLVRELYRAGDHSHCKYCSMYSAIPHRKVARMRRRAFTKSARRLTRSCCVKR